MDDYIKAMLAEPVRGVPVASWIKFFKDHETQGTGKPRPDLWVRPPACQPRRAGKEADMSIDAAPEETARAARRPVDVEIIGRDDR